jgi:hypothetical protein
MWCLHIVRTGELLSLNQNQLRIMMKLLTGHCYLNGHLFKLGLVGSVGCDRCKQAFEMSSHVLCECEALVVLRFKHLGHHFLKPGDFANISVSKVLHIIQSAGLLMPGKRAAQKIENGRSARVTVVPTQMYSIVCTMTLSCSGDEDGKFLNEIDTHLPVYSASSSRRPLSGNQAVYHISIKSTKYSV